MKQGVLLRQVGCDPEKMATKKAGPVMALPVSESYLWTFSTLLFQRGISL